MRPGRLIRSAIVLKPSTFLAFHGALVKRKYRLLFTSKSRGKPGPKGPSPELVAAIVEMKRKNPRFGCRRIAQQIADADATKRGAEEQREILIQKRETFDRERTALLEQAVQEAQVERERLVTAAR